MKITIRELPYGRYFTLKPVYGECVEKTEIYVRGKYDRLEKEYCCHTFADVNEEIFFNGNKEVYEAFIL